MIALTLPEIRRLTIALALPALRCTHHILAWSNWRRRRQHQARLSHYRRRGHPLA
ncbi:hypothetical protein IU459_36825 [Nocardia amamiensis]|uniref:Transposase n=1 Tax=Nocardia amamiensis TaxID=404578 RepID=A0ABS0D2F7_9NOCA|nr:hypothetical protein [Nocardia amamiensis]MBF6303025.1 hypothetical protein [Nocardia amamiensis]